MKTSKKIVTFFVSTVLLTNWIFSTLIIIKGGGLSQNIPYALVLMVSPALIALIIHFASFRTLKGFGWKLGKIKYLIFSYIIPASYILIPYVIIAIFGIIKVDPIFLQALTLTEYAKIFLINILLLTLLVLGEEIGWRGFLLPQLCRIVPYKQASSIVGIVWVIVHYPILIFSDYNQTSTPLFFRIICFTIIAFSANIIINWLRVKSGSLWTAVLFHSTHNSLLQDLNPLFVSNKWSAYVLSEAGIGLALSCMIIATFYISKDSPITLHKQYR
jgi:membrane protease YdiL (CAAX protease family)